MVAAAAHPTRYRSGTYRWFVATGVVLLLLALAHLAGHFAGGTPTDPTLVQLEKLLADSRPVPGSEHSMGDILGGMSLFLSLGSTAFGVLALVLSLSAQPPAALLDLARFVYALLLATLAAISITHWFVAPTTFIVAALVTTLLSLWRDGRATA